MLDQDIPPLTIDARLAYLSEAYKSIQKRWCRQKHNRKLKLRMASLEREIAAHATELAARPMGPNLRPASRKSRDEEMAASLTSNRY
ncbi:hypothetical protein HPB48_012229 [Haemaphysalis longicornis]|uniref:Uncharacterized protein n=1 Tax=Haemaphysalis longicornis TaxID=44386 RepID=A0A9J6GC53_HAELO|nr:hypothetical protein HPB48_012229 [Haemaphysalis longicornis]